MIDTAESRVENVGMNCQDAAHPLPAIFTLLSSSAVLVVGDG